MSTNWQLSLFLLAILPLIVLGESKSTCEDNCNKGLSCGNKNRCSMYCACKSPSSVVAGGHSGKYRYLEFNNGKKVPCSDVYNKCKRGKRIGKRIYTPVEDRDSFFMQSEINWQGPDDWSSYTLPFQSNEELYSARQTLKDIIRKVLRQKSSDYYDTNSEQNIL